MHAHRYNKCTTIHIETYKYILKYIRTPINTHRYTLIRINTYGLLFKAILDSLTTGTNPNTTSMNTRRHTKTQPHKTKDTQPHKLANPQTRNHTNPQTDKQIRTSTNSRQTPKRFTQAHKSLNLQTHKPLTQKP